MTRAEEAFIVCLGRKCLRSFCVLGWWGGVSVHFVPWEGVRSWSCVQTGAERVAFILCFGRPPCIHFVLRRFPQAPKLTDEWLPRGLGAFIVCLGSGFCVDFVLWEVEGRGGGSCCALGRAAFTGLCSNWGGFAFIVYLGMEFVFNLWFGKVGALLCAAQIPPSPKLKNEPGARSVFALGSFCARLCPRRAGS